MKNRTNVMLSLLAVVLLAISAGCAQERTEVAEATEDALPPLPTTTDQLQAMIQIDDPTLGNEVSADGSIPMGSTDNDFEAGEPIFVAMEVGDAPPGTTVRVVWQDAAGKQLAEDSKNLNGETYVNFQAPDTSTWAEGEYKVLIMAGDQIAHEEDFNVARRDRV
ncbi:MAG TPA: hypothetical protein VMS56_15340 [Thermoanaerobaculia bacterium]|nr:hypothetical protein [Thermoanaerobaculia bacterium]